MPELDLCHRIRNRDVKIVALEGMPGLGKTSALVAIGWRYGTACLPLSELNLGRPGAPAPKYGRDHWRPFHEMWTTRRVALGSLLGEQSFILMDRSYYSTLAVCYALDAIGAGGDLIGASKAGWGPKPQHDLIFVLDGSPELGLRRRRADHAVPPPWDDRRFLDALRAFYLDQLQQYCPGRLVRVNADEFDPDQLAKCIEKHLEDLGVTRGAPARTLDPHDVDVLSSAGLRLRLGRPYLPAFEVLGRPTMYFRQHSLVLAGGAVTFFDDIPLANLRGT